MILQIPLWVLITCGVPIYAVMAGASHALMRRIFGEPRSDDGECCRVLGAIFWPVVMPVILMVALAKVTVLAFNRFWPIKGTRENPYA